MQELLSKALHADDPSLYTVLFRDKDALRELPLLEFLELSEGFQRIPAWRIERLKRAGVVLFARRRPGEGQSV